MWPKVELLDPTNYPSPKYVSLNFMNYYIRPAKPSDEAFLWQMLYEAAHMAETGETLETAKTNPNLARYVANWGLPHDIGFIAETKIIGNW